MRIETGRERREDERKKEKRGGTHLRGSASAVRPPTSNLRSLPARKPAHTEGAEGVVALGNRKSRKPSFRLSLKLWLGRGPFLD